MDEHIINVPKPSNREKLLTAGLRVVHERGFGTSVRDIAQAAGVPQGSFTNHFGSKEAFGLEIVDLYKATFNEAVAATLRNDALPPLKRLRLWFQDTLECLKQDDMRRGCLYANLSAEAIEHSEAMRRRIAGIFTENQKSVAYCLQAAVDAGELFPNVNVSDTAGFIVSSFEGAILIAKAQRKPEPIERFMRVLFSSVLSPRPGHLAGYAHGSGPHPSPTRSRRRAQGRGGSASGS
jgi:TetR/AcrR family transcriptional repressor of nem operon